MVSRKVSTGAGAGPRPACETSCGRVPIGGPLQASGFSGPDRAAASSVERFARLRAGAPSEGASRLGGLGFSVSRAGSCLRLGASASHEVGRLEKGPRWLCWSHSARPVPHVPDSPHPLLVDPGCCDSSVAGAGGEPSLCAGVLSSRGAMLRGFGHASPFYLCVAIQGGT